jgi:hypothetical protein
MAAHKEQHLKGSEILLPDTPNQTAVKSVQHFGFSTKWTSLQLYKKFLLVGTNKKLYEFWKSVFKLYSQLL